jgi:hypothetical protein
MNVYGIQNYKRKWDLGYLESQHYSVKSYEDIKCIDCVKIDDDMSNVSEKTTAYIMLVLVL